MDKLDGIFEMQIKLNEYIIEKRGIEEDIPVEQWIQRLALATIEEVMEVANEANYKWWKKEKKIDKGKITEELVDILHFYISMCTRLGINSDELFEAYKIKNKENYDRQDGNSMKKGYEK